MLTDTEGGKYQEAAKIHMKDVILCYKLLPFFLSFPFFLLIPLSPSGDQEVDSGLWALVHGLRTELWS